MRIFELFFGKLFDRLSHSLLIHIVCMSMMYSHCLHVYDV